jgi:prevent-host-death family protein
MKTVSARDANQHFSKLLADVEAGEEVVITRRGRPVARMIATRTKLSPEQRAKALAELNKIMDRGYRLGGKPMTRDEMHERGR